MTCCSWLPALPLPVLLARSSPIIYASARVGLESARRATGLCPSAVHLRPHCVNCFFLCFFCSLGHLSLTVRSVFPSFCVSKFLYARFVASSMNAFTLICQLTAAAASAVVAARKRQLQYQRGDFLARKSDVHAYLPTYDISFFLPIPSVTVLHKVPLAVWATNL